ncbi:hypothetical protein Tco_1363856 [Tanacetum coccineum]
MNSQPTGFGEQYEQLFKGSKVNLCGTWIGFEVLNEAIMRVCMRLPKKWKEISICARKNEGGQNLEIYKRFAQDALNVYLWQEGTQNFDVTISRVGRRGFGNGGESYLLAYDIVNRGDEAVQKQKRCSFNVQRKRFQEVNFKKLALSRLHSD